MSESLYRAAFDRAPSGIAVLEAGDGRLGRVLVANSEFCRLLGYDHAAAIGADLKSLLDGVSAAAGGTVEQLLESVVDHHFEETVRRDDGSLAFLSFVATIFESADDSRPLAVVGVRDATDIHELAARFAVVADHDLVTALLNRRGFETRLGESLARSVRYGEAGAVVLLDVDRFKSVNDTDGHAAGDAVLQTIAEALRARLRASDLVARIGGDEFALMLGRVHPEAALVMIESLLEQLALQMAKLPGAAAAVTVSAGIAAFNGDHPTTVAKVLEAADAALYDAKRSGRGRASLSPDLA